MQQTRSKTKTCPLFGILQECFVSYNSIMDSTQTLPVSQIDRKQLILHFINVVNFMILHSYCMCKMHFLWDNLAAAYLGCSINYFTREKIIKVKAFCDENHDNNGNYCWRD